MLFNVSAHLQYQASVPVIMLLNIQPCRTQTQEIIKEELETTNADYKEISGENGIRFLLLNITNPGCVGIYYKGVVECNFQQGIAKQQALPITEIETDAVSYLFPSRYCPSDRVNRLANDLFRGINDVYQTVLAITAWIHKHIEYLGGATDEHSTALDVLIGRQGVCRDFAHLAITFCRAMNIPARYVTGYAYQLTPQDFHAYFEACIGNEWIVFDATGLAPLNGLVRIGSGKDAADASFANLFGAIQFDNMSISCELNDPQIFKPFFRSNL